MPLASSSSAAGPPDVPAALLPARPAAPPGATLVAMGAPVMVAASVSGSTAAVAGSVVAATPGLSTPDDANSIADSAMGYGRNRNFDQLDLDSARAHHERVPDLDLRAEVDLDSARVGLDVIQDIDSARSYSGSEPEVVSGDEAQGPEEEEGVDGSGAGGAGEEPDLFARYAVTSVGGGGTSHLRQRRNSGGAAGPSGPAAAGPSSHPRSSSSYAMSPLRRASQVAGSSAEGHSEGLLDAAAAAALAAARALSPSEAAGAGSPLQVAPRDDSARYGAHGSALEGSRVGAAMGGRYLRTDTAHALDLPSTSDSTGPVAPHPDPQASPAGQDSGVSRGPAGGVADAAGGGGEGLVLEDPAELLMRARSIVSSAAAQQGGVGAEDPQAQRPSSTTPDMYHQLAGQLLDRETLAAARQAVLGSSPTGLPLPVLQGLRSSSHGRAVERQPRDSASGMLGDDSAAAGGLTARGVVVDLYGLD